MPSHWLSLSVWVPIVAGFIVLAVGDRNPREARVISLLGAIVGFLVTIPLVTGFQTETSAMQFVELAPWIPRFNVNYHLGVDGISVLFILLNSFITVLVVLAGREGAVQKSRHHQGRPVHGCVPGDVGTSERHLRGPRRRAPLRLLRGDADPDVSGHRRLGRAQPRLRRGEILLVHPIGVATDADRLSLPLQQI